MKGNRICLITPGHLSSNPRLVKEAIALDEAGYQVHLVFTQNVDYLIAHDFEILKTHPNWTYDVLNWTNLNSKNKFQRSMLALLQKISRFVSPYLPYLFIYQLAINRNYFWQLKKAVLWKADLYIAHNLAALSIAYYAAKKNKTKCGFDAEDFHRQEITNDVSSLAYKRAKFIEDTFIPQLDYLTTASPMITAKYLELYPHLGPTTINNVFSVAFLQKPINNQSEELKLFWFSQTIGTNRGIEDVIKAIGMLNDCRISLTLLGNINEHTKQYFNSFAIKQGMSLSQLIFLPPIHSDELFKIASYYDIGLALEPGFCLNNSIALSNKIFTYLTAGLAVIASETLAQKDFMMQNPLVGKSYPIGDISTLAQIIKEYNQNRDLLSVTKQNGLQLAQTRCNWELEKVIFLKSIDEVLR